MGSEEWGTTPLAVSKEIGQRRTRKVPLFSFSSLFETLEVEAVLNNYQKPLSPPGLDLPSLGIAASLEHDTVRRSDSSFEHFLRRSPMQQGAGSLFVGSVVYGLGLSIGLALFAIVGFFVCLKIFGWWMGRENRKAEREAEAAALKDLLSNYSKNGGRPPAE